MFALFCEFCVVLLTMSVFVDDLESRHVFQSLVIALALSVYLKMPVGWDGDEKLIENGKDRWHDVAVPALSALFLLPIMWVINCFL
jgi:hypothetical protein